VLFRPAVRQGFVGVVMLRFRAYPGRLGLASGRLPTLFGISLVRFCTLLFLGASQSSDY
jgi:hypothetical protein